MDINESVQEIRKVSREFVRELGLLKEEHIAEGLSLSQSHCLLEIQIHSKLSNNQVASILNLDKSTTSRLTKNLHQKGLLKITPNPVDKREKFFELTRQGLTILEQMNQTTNQKIKEALLQVSPEEHVKIIDGISLYVRLLKQSKNYKE